MIGRSLGFTRWYDRIPELSQAVRMLEKASPQVQFMVASVIMSGTHLHQVSQRSEYGLKKIGTEKVLGLMKSKGKRRWYDQDPMVHKAFNYLFLMSDAERHESGIKIIISLNALKAKRKELSHKQQHELVKVVFEQPLQQLMEKTAFTFYPDAYLEEEAEEEAAEQTPEMNEVDYPAISSTSHANAPAGFSRGVEIRLDFIRPKVDPEPNPVPVFKGTLVSDEIESSPSGLRIIKLKEKKET